MVFILIVDSQVDMRRSYGLPKARNILSILAPFGFLLNILENGISRGPERVSRRGIRTAKTHRLYGTFCFRIGRKEYGIYPM